MKTKDNSKVSLTVLEGQAYDQTPPYYLKRNVMEAIGKVAAEHGLKEGYPASNNQVGGYSGIPPELKSHL
jgi:hypothetical protein